MLTVVDRPVIQYVVDEAREAGIEHFIFVTGRNKAVIEDHFDIQFELNHTLAQRGKDDQLAKLQRLQPLAGQTSFTRQQEPLGLGHAVWCSGSWSATSRSRCLLPDMIMQSQKSCMAEMVELYENTGGNIIAVQECDPAEAHKYGIVGKGGDIANGFQITQMVEKPKQGTAPSNLYINGRYILQPEIFSILEKQERGAGQRDPADRRHAEAGEATGLLRLPLPGPRLRLRLAGRLRRGKCRVCARRPDLGEDGRRHRRTARREGEIRAAQRELALDCDASVPRARPRREERGSPVPCRLAPQGGGCGPFAGSVALDARLLPLASVIGTGMTA